MVGGEEVLDGFWVVGGEGAEGPGEGFDDHVVAVVGQEVADGEGAGGVAVAAAGLGVEADRGDEGGAAPPTIGGPGPAMHIVIADLPIHPSGAGEIAAEDVDRGPVVDVPAEALDGCGVPGSEGGAVVVDDFLGPDSQIEVYEAFGELKHLLGLGGRDSPGELAADGPDEGHSGRRQGVDAGTEVAGEGLGVKGFQPVGTHRN